jgi:hypothetical protein
MSVNDELCSIYVKLLEKSLGGYDLPLYGDKTNIQTYYSDLMY